MLNREQNFTKEFYFFLEKFKKKENFNLLRFSDGELFMLQKKQIKLGNFFVKLDGKITGIKHFPKFDQKTYDPVKNHAFLEHLIQSFTYRSPEYFVGINCKCCVGNLNYKWQFDEHLKEDHDNLTWSNVLINSNYPFFLKEFYPEIKKRGANLICNIQADLTNLDWVKKDFRLGNNAFSDVTLIQTIKDYIETKKIENEVFLFSASAFSNVAQYELGKLFKRNTYIDIGTSLSHEFGIPAEREYLLKFKEGKLSELKSCTWN